MESGCRALRLLNRLLRRPVGVTAYRNVTGTAVKEELNTELLNSFNQDIKLGGAVPVFRRALLFPSRVALQDEFGIYTYAGLYQAASVLSSEISAQLVGDTERTIAYMCSNDASHIIVQWAIWMSGNIAVPLTSLHPPDMIKYFLTDSMADLAICTQEYEKVLRPITLELSRPLLITGRDKEIAAQLYQPTNELLSEKVEQALTEVGHSNSWYGDAEALIIYTSAVPLTSLHPPDMIKYFLTDSMADLAICTQEYEKVLRPITLELSRPLLITGRDKEIAAQLYQPTNELLSEKVEQALTEVGHSNSWYGDAEALIIYTSGTTSKPKGVVWTHSMLQTQVAALHNAWRCTASDVTLHALPLHHIHGQLNSMLVTLAAGARLRMLPSFASHTVWARLLGMGERDEFRATVFHGVPAMFARLCADHERMFADARTAQYVRQTLASRMRLICSGSAPLPETLAHKWEEISGIRLLERYGMSEVGMALSNPYRPVEARAPGAVGAPLPGVGARIAKDLEPLLTVEASLPNTQISLERLGLLPKSENDSEGYDWTEPAVTEHCAPENGVFEGELLLKGPAVFSRYWNRAPSLDNTDFTSDGWFRTGDTASYSDGRFRILGRTSIDIIKSGGYKISALQVESAILEHPAVADAAVLGVEHEEMGEIVSAVVVLKEKCQLNIKELKSEAGKKLAPYQLPKTMLIVDTMPRNAMGKLDKKEIRKLYGEQLVLKRN